MELKWLQDFVMLADSGSFSRAAKERNVTQPAFSRRIRALERWLGVELVDRSCYPMVLTAAGARFYDSAAQILQQIHHERAQLRAPEAEDSVLAFAAPHSLATYFFPRLLGEIERQIGQLRVRLISENLHDSVETLVQGGCDFLIAFHYAELPLLLGAERCQFVILGGDRLLPVCAPTAIGVPRFPLSEQAEVTAPVLGYDRGSYLGRVLEMAFTERGRLLRNRIYENALVEGLKAMALTGRGLAWLPEAAIQPDLASGRLVPAGGPEWDLTLQIRLYRRVAPHGAPHGTLPERVWQACSDMGGHAVSA